MLTNDAWDIVSYHHQDLMDEAEGERLAAMLPKRRALSPRQALARACYRLASWLDARGSQPDPTDRCAEDWGAPIGEA